MMNYMKTMNSKIIKKIYLVCLAIVAIMVVVGLILSNVTSLEALRASYIRDVAVDSIGMLVCGILLIGIYAGDIKDKQNTSMFRMIFVISLLFLIDLLSSYAEGNSKYAVVVLIVNTFGFVLEDVLGFSYWIYIRDELNLSGRFKYVENRICLITLIVAIVVDILNIKLGLFFTVSEAGEYVDGQLEFLSDVAIIIIFLIAAVAILHKADRNINEKLVLMSFESFAIVAYIVGAVTQGYNWINPAHLLSILLIYIRIFTQREKKIIEQQVTLTKQSTALMISQIQPHFLYNVLTTISNLCVTDPEEAEETTVLFSQYLRTNLDSLRNQDPVPFATELSHIRTYVELEKKRFGDILNVEYDINEQNFRVPSLGLQPIVENSIKHGIRGKNAPGHIKIGTYKAEGGYKIVIEDDGIGFDMNMPAKDDGRSHVGMINVKERLKQMCNASVNIESSPGNGCRTDIFIPEEN